MYLVVKYVGQYDFCIEQVFKSETNAANCAKKWQSEVVEERPRITYQVEEVEVGD